MGPIDRVLGAVPKPHRRSAAMSQIRTFDLAVAMPGFSIVRAWHPWMDAAPVHRWLRALIFETFKSMS